MLSSEDFKPHLPRVRELGLDGYMMKPITRRGLFEAINRLLNDTNRSGVEARPGKKDPRALRELMREVEAANRSADGDPGCTFQERSREKRS